MKTCHFQFAKMHQHVAHRRPIARWMSELQFIYYFHISFIICAVYAGEYMQFNEHFKYGV